MFTLLKIETEKNFLILLIHLTVAVINSLHINVTNTFLLKKKIGKSFKAKIFNEKIDMLFFFFPFLPIS